MTSLKKYGQKSRVEVMVDDGGILWLKEKHIKSNLGHSNLPVIANKRDSSYKKHRYELVNKPKKQTCGNFSHEKLAKKLIMDCRTTNESRHFIKGSYAIELIFLSMATDLQ